MSRFSSIDNSIWNDSEFENLDLLGKSIYFYLLTCPIGNSAGYFRLPIKQIVCDLDVEKEKILPQLLSQKKLWKYDEKTNQVLINSFLKYNKAISKSQLKSINRAIKPLTVCELHIDFLNRLIRFSGAESWKEIDKEIVMETLLMADGDMSDNAIELISNITPSLISNPIQYNTTQYNTIGSLPR